ncbi:hypothetical protein Tco_0610493 [Tanacetum coccineum]
MMYERPPTTPFQTPPRNITFPFQRSTLMFQQHQDESLYDAWTRYKDLICKVPHHGLSLWSQIKIFFDHIDRYTQIDINYAAGGNLRGLSAEEAWETIEDYVQCDKLWKNPTSTISDQTIANLKDQLVGNEVVRVKIPSCMSWLDAYDEPLDDLDMLEDKVDNQSPQSTPQVLSSFEVYTSPVTYPEEVEETLGTPMEEEPLDQTKLDDVGLTNHDIPLSFREVPSFDEPKPQLLPNFSPLDVNLGDKRGIDPPIKPHSPDSFRMKVVDKSTINTPPSSHMASFHPKDTYYYYHPCIDDPKKCYGFKPGLLGHSGSLGVDFLKLEIIKNDWELEFKDVSFLERGLNSPVRPKEVESVRIERTHHLEHIIQQPKFQHVTPSHNNGVYRYYHPHLNSSVGEPSLNLLNKGRVRLVTRTKTSAFWEATQHLLFPHLRVSRVLILYYLFYYV